MLLAQLTTGTIEGRVTDAHGRAAPGAPIFLRGEPNYQRMVRADERGEFKAILPYGAYRLSASPDGDGIRVVVAALATVQVHLSIGESGAVERLDDVWTDTTGARTYPEPYSLAAILLSRQPAMVTQPLDFTGVLDNRLALVSSRTISWTSAQFKLDGMDATDSYQPGLPAILPDTHAIDELAVREASSQTTSAAYATEVGVFLATPERARHGELSTSDTSAILSASNLPAPPDRGLVQQTERFRWLTEDAAQIGGGIANRADIFASAAGQWSDQTVGLAAPGDDQGSRLLFGNVRARARAGDRDRFDVLFSGSRISLSNFATPAGLEALEGRRDAPSFVLPAGFDGQSESDRMDYWQAGWVHTFAQSLLEMRYGYSIARFDTVTPAQGQSKVELLDGAVTGPPPIGNRAVRPRQNIAGAWQSALGRNRFSAGGAWSWQAPENRFTTPSNMNLITANGAPAFIILFNTPATTRERIESSNMYLADHLNAARGLSFDLGLLGDFTRGGPIAWNSVSPRAGFAWQIPHARRLTLRGDYFRVYAPLSGRDLDFGNANSLGGSEYQWINDNGSGLFEPGELGALLMRFGGPYSSIAPSLGRPYSDEFDTGAALRLTSRSSAAIHLFRRDDKDRLADIDVGIPASAYTPVTIAPQLTVYSQNPTAFGQDRYELMNPPGLREQYTGFVAELSGEWRGLTAHASFAAEKSYGPTNPGDAVTENDPGVVGALFIDPNASVNVSNRDFMDRAYVGKLQAAYRLPGRIEIASVTDYLDGLVFAQQLLVTGLAQGPIVVGATVRGSPEGGNRAEHVLNWNMRAQRGFSMAQGRIVAAVDVFNVTNEAHRVQESDVSSAAFLLRLPVTIQEPRSARFSVRYEF
jgi:Carboxypeptidase regulatory-like domain